MKLFSLFLREEQIEDVRRISERTHLSMAEVMRQMQDRCLEKTVAYQMFPVASGCLSQVRTT